MLINVLDEKRSSKGVPHRSWVIAFLLAFGVLVNYLDRVNLSVAKQTLERGFGINKIIFGYLLSVYNWTYSTLKLPMGVLLDRSAPTLLAPHDSVGKVGGIMNFANQIAAVAAPIVTGYLIGSRNNNSRGVAVAAGAILTGIAGYAFLLGRIEQIPDPEQAGRAT